MNSYTANMDLFGGKKCNYLIGYFLTAYLKWLYVWSQTDATDNFIALCLSAMYVLYGVAKLCIII
jgi:hypothetical protein